MCSTLAAMQSAILSRPQACPARPAGRGASRSCRRGVSVKASSETEAYVPPSYRTAATELSALQRFSEVVPDVLLSQTLQKVEAPRAATASRSVLGGIIGNPTAPARYKIAIEQAKYFDRCLPYSGEDQTACQIDKALVNLGSLFLEKVEGRVSTEVDPKVAKDTEKLIMRGQNLIELYEEVGVSRGRVLLRIPATWEGVQAAKALEAQKITTHLVLVYSFAQGAAAAQAGVSVIQPNVGRLHDWYNRHPGYVRDPKGPLEESYFGKKSDINPGVLLVQRLYSYVKSHHPKTLIMASGLRTKEEALSLSGCDYLVIGPKVLEAMGKNTTLEGYNDGLSATSEQDAMEPVLSPAKAQQEEFLPDELAEVTERIFREEMGPAAKDLLEEGLTRLVEDANRLEPYFLQLAGGQT